MSLEEAEVLKERSLVFLKNAEDLVNEEHYDIAAFNLEQYCQLMVKYKLLLKIGAYPRTNSLTALLGELSKVSSNVAELLNNRKNIIFITKIEEAYISSRYLARRYMPVEVEEMLKFVKEVFRSVVEGV